MDIQNGKKKKDGWIRYQHNLQIILDCLSYLVSWFKVGYGRILHPINHTFTWPRRMIIEMLTLFTVTEYLARLQQGILNINVYYSNFMQLNCCRTEGLTMASFQATLRGARRLRPIKSRGRGTRTVGLHK